MLSTLDVLTLPVLTSPRPLGPRPCEHALLSAPVLVATDGSDAAGAATHVAAAAPTTVICREARGCRCSAARRSSADELRAFADRADAELIAVGSQRHTTAHSLVRGSMTTTLVRDGRHSLLVTPPVAADRPFHCRSTRVAP